MNLFKINDLVFDNAFDIFSFALIFLSIDILRQTFSSNKSVDNIIRSSILYIAQEYDQE